MPSALVVDGVATMDRPYLARREILDKLNLEGGLIRVPPFWTDIDPDHLLEAAEQAGLEGIVSKRTDSVYRPVPAAATGSSRPCAARPRQ